jgi:outer membrane receptor for ferrienterochelin and colicins
MYTKNGTFIGLETSAWYTFFQFYYSDYDSNQPNYLKKLNGYAVTKGVSTNVDWFQQWSKMILGVTYMDVTKTENNIKQDNCLLKDLREPGPSPA